MLKLNTVPAVKESLGRVRELLNSGAKITLSVSTPEAEELLDIARFMYSEGIPTLLNEIDRLTPQDENKDNTSEGVGEET